MPLHDWTDLPGWEGMHTYWMTEIARALRADLPPGYRALIGSSPLVKIDLASVKPDVVVTSDPAPPSVRPAANPMEPDLEVAIATIDEDTTVAVAQGNRLVAVVELVSPRNKDRPAAREKYAGRYVNYVKGGVNLLVVDVHRGPVGFSFPQAIAAALGEDLSPLSAPSAVTYRVGGRAAYGGRMLAVWQKPLVVGEPLPAMPLPLNPDLAVTVPLEPTYARAAADCYLD